MVAEGVMHGVSLPAFSTALAFYDGYRSAWLPANVIQVKETIYHPSGGGGGPPV